MQYEIDINIDDAGLQAIQSSGQAVTIVKSVVTNAVASGNLPVAWLQFQPMESNTVTWQENYYAYATTTNLQAGAKIIRTSHTAGNVQLGWTYTLNPAGVFVGAAGGGATTFTASNQHGDQLGFGLAQSANVNGVPVLAPLNVVTMLNNELATFTPIETISVYLSAYVDNGVVISQIAGDALEITLTSQSPSATLGFNDSSNSFYLASTTRRARRENSRGLETAHHH
jgi:hypothetical protein